MCLNWISLRSRSHGPARSQSKVQTCMCRDCRKTSRSPTWRQSSTATAASLLRASSPTISQVVSIRTHDSPSIFILRRVESFSLESGELHSKLPARANRKLAKKLAIFRIFQRFWRFHDFFPRLHTFSLIQLITFLSMVFRPHPPIDFDYVLFSSFCWFYVSLFSFFFKYNNKLNVTRPVRWFQILINTHSHTHHRFSFRLEMKRS